jgi:peptide/nickel transport system ATP-binding protein
MKPLVEVKNLTKSFHQRKGEDVTILRGIDLSIAQSETVCVVGESGCGKTTLGKILAGLQEYSGGTFTFDNKEVGDLDRSDWKKFRRSVQMIHQNPYESLNPTKMVFDMLAAPLRHHKKITEFSELYHETVKLLEIVGLTPVDDFIDKYPGNLSGGQRQRVSIARVLAMDPQFIVVDEATSMIDTSMRISLLTTLKEIQERLNVAYLYITHDLALGRYFAWGHRIMVMYLGKIIEIGPTGEVIGQPQHPYTKAILSAARIDEDHPYELHNIDIPSFTNIGPGCSLFPRCPQAMEGLCDVVEPQLLSSAPGRQVACHLYTKEEKRLG